MKFQAEMLPGKRRKCARQIGIQGAVAPGGESTAAYFHQGVSAICSADKCSGDRINIIARQRAGWGRRKKGERRVGDTMGDAETDDAAENRYNSARPVCCSFRPSPNDIFFLPFFPTVSPVSATSSSIFLFSRNNCGTSLSIADSRPSEMKGPCAKQIRPSGLMHRHSK